MLRYWCQKNCFTTKLLPGLALSTKSFYRTSPNVKVESQNLKQQQNVNNLQKVKKPTSQLILTAIILKICSFKFLVNYGEKLLKTSNQVFGKSFAHQLLKTTFYQQFCIGNSTEEICRQCEIIKQVNMFPLLCITDEEESNPSPNKEFVEAWYENNKKKMMRCIDLTCMAMESITPKQVQMKLTALIDAAILKKLSPAIELKITDGINKWIQGYLFGKPEEIKSNQMAYLTTEELQHASHGIQRFIDICSYAAKKEVAILVDGEYVDINPAINHICCQMMLCFNRTAPVVQCTYQCYLKDLETELEKHKKFCTISCLHFGGKIVRGAYLESERKRAKLFDTPSPVYDTWEETNQTYNRVVAKLLQEISENRKFHVTVATHNVESINQAMNEIYKLKLPNASNQVVFAQLYGLSNHLSLMLVDNGFKVYKSSPIGSVEETIPYMIRRAKENNSVIQNSRGERKLIVREILSRLRFFW